MLIRVSVFLPGGLGRVSMQIPVPRSMAMEMQRRQVEAEKRERELRARIERMKERSRQDRLLLLNHPPQIDLSSSDASTLKFGLTIASRIIVLSKNLKTEEDEGASRPLQIKDNLVLLVQISGASVEKVGGGGSEHGSKKKKGKTTKKESGVTAHSPWKEAKVMEEGPGCFVISLIQPSRSYLIRARVGEKRLTDNLRSICCWGEWGPEVSFTTDPEPMEA